MTAAVSPRLTERNIACALGCRLGRIARMSCHLEGTCHYRLLPSLPHPPARRSGEGTTVNVGIFAFATFVAVSTV